MHGGQCVAQEVEIVGTAPQAMHGDDKVHGLGHRGGGVDQAVIRSADVREPGTANTPVVVRTVVVRM